MIEFIVQGGAVLWVIMALSVVACVIIIERILYLRRISVDEDKLFVRIKSSLLEGHYNEALAICDQNLSPFSNLLKIGIENRHQPENVQRDILKDAAALEAPKLESGLSALGTISSIAPLLGLLGTVTGTDEGFRRSRQVRSRQRSRGLGYRRLGSPHYDGRRYCRGCPCRHLLQLFRARVGMILTKLENQVNALVLLINAANGAEKKGGLEEK